MTPQEEELAGKIMQKLDDQMTMIREHYESMAMLLASIESKLARIESSRVPLYGAPHGAPRWRTEYRCAVSQTRRDHGCPGR